MDVPSMDTLGMYNYWVCCLNFPATYHGSFASYLQWLSVLCDNLANKGKERQLKGGTRLGSPFGRILGKSPSDPLLLDYSLSLL